MLQRVPDIEITADDPYESDKLDRKQNVESIAALLLNTTGPFVLSIDSPWGTGKTSFLRMLQHELADAGHPVVMLNAWESDFSNDPMIAIMGEIDSLVDREQDAGTKASLAWTKTKKHGLKFLKRTAGAASKLATGGILDVEPLLEDLASEPDDGNQLTAIQRYRKQQEGLEGFRIALEEYAKEAGRQPVPEVDSGSAQDGTEGKSDADAAPVRSLVVLIDELDRCRPVYAVELLERAKHLFSVVNVIFVLAVDSEQLSHSLRTLYGAEMDTDGYLRRFIDLRFSLPAPSYESFIKFTFDRCGIADYLKSGERRQYGVAVAVLMVWAKSMKLSLRDLEQIIGRASIAALAGQAGLLGVPELYLSLCVISEKKPKLFAKIREGAVTAAQVMGEIEKDFVDEEQEPWRPVLEAQFAATSDFSSPLTTYESEHAAMSTSGARRGYLTRLLEVAKDRQFRNRGQGIRSQLIREIEMSERFSAV